MLGQKDVKSRILESLAASSVGAAWLLVMHSLKTLPDRIPTHFGLNGAANATGPASSLWILPIAISALYVFLSALQLVPNRLMNYPVKITDRNRNGVYALGREMLPAVKVCTLLTLLAVEWGAIDGATRGSLGPSFIELIAVPLLLLLGLVLYYTLRMRAV